MKKKTGCECPLAGFCNRHGINKNEHFHKLCENHPGYFNMWDECRGPGQEFVDCTEQKTEEEVIESRKVEEPKKDCEGCKNKNCQGGCQKKKHELPPKLQMAKNLAKATVEHAKSGFAHATPEEQAARLEICKGCEFYIEEKDQCSKCGCYLKSKSTWKSGKCPIGKW